MVMEIDIEEIDIEEELGISVEVEETKKRIRSMKCCICDEVKTTVMKVIDPLTLRFDGVKKEVSMCPGCYVMCDTL